jgi:hypothetical protein
MTIGCENKWPHGIQTSSENGVTITCIGEPNVVDGSLTYSRTFLFGMGKDEKGCLAVVTVPQADEIARFLARGAPRQAQPARRQDSRVAEVKSRLRKLFIPPSRRRG